MFTFLFFSGCKITSFVSPIVTLYHSKFSNIIVSPYTNFRQQSYSVNTHFVNSLKQTNIQKNSNSISNFDLIQRRIRILRCRHRGIKSATSCIKQAIRQIPHTPQALQFSLCTNIEAFCIMALNAYQNKIQGVFGCLTQFQAVIQHTLSSYCLATCKKHRMARSIGR